MYIKLLVSIPLAMKWGTLGSALGTFIELSKILSAMIIPITVGFLLNVFDLINPDYKSIGLFAVGYTMIHAASVWIIEMKRL